MKISPKTLVGLLLALTLGAGCNGGTGSGTAEEKRFADALEKAHGDPSKLGPEDKKMFDDWKAKNPSPNGLPGPGGAPSSSPGPGASGR